jgi:SAM-dependent methyltransferase
MRQETGAAVEFCLLDIAEGLPYDDGSFTGIYSHLSLHYFDDDVTRRVFRDLWRVTKPGGVLGFSVRSTSDAYYGEGVLMEEDVYCRKGHVRHFFSREYAQEMLRDWDILLLEECGGEYANKRPSAFIRAVATKPAG